MEHAKQHGMSERRACQVAKQPRGTQRYHPTQRDDEDALTRAIITLASQYGRFGYRRITIELNKAGWQVGKDRVERIWRREGLKVPKKQKPRGRLWLNDGSCVRLRPEHRNHVWSYDFVSAFTHDGRTVRMLNLIDEFTRECIAIRPAASAEQPTRDGGAGRRHDHARYPRAHPFRQRSRVHRSEPGQVASWNRSKDPVHQARLSLGEWLL